MIKFPISLFIDSNIFDSSKYDFSSNGVLNLLIDYVNEKKIKLYISHIVEGEVREHLNKKAAHLCNAINKEREEHFKKISENLVMESSISHIFNRINKKALKEELNLVFDNFLLNSKAIILDSKSVDCNQIVNDYFNYTLPFENKESKRNEFPDALMVSKLKMDFGIKCPLYIVSNDKGFCKSFSNIEGFKTFDKLKDIFDIINQQQKSIYETVVQYINSEKAFKIIGDKIKDKILDNNNIEIDGNDYDRKGYMNGYDFINTEIVKASILSVKFLSMDKIVESSISLTIESHCNIFAECSYYDDENKIWDSEDKDYIYLESTYINEEHEPIFDCEVSLKYNDDENCLFVEKVDFSLILDQSTRVNRSDIFKDKLVFDVNKYARNIEDDVKELEWALGNNYDK